MKKQEIEKEKRGKLAKEVRPNNGVIITFYVESSAPHIHGRINHTKQIRPTQRPKKTQTARSCGYDRRAQLLAYAQKLRKAHPPLAELPPRSQKGIHNDFETGQCMQAKPRWPVKSEAQARRRVGSPRRLQKNAQSKWRYERVMRDGNTEKVDQPCRPKCFNGHNKASKSNSNIFRKVRVVLKEMAGGCKSNV